MASFYRSCLGWLALLAAVLPVVLAAPEPGTVGMSFRRVRANKRQNAHLLSARQSVGVTLTNELTFYFINVTVGTPPQSQSLQIDTGSSDIWFPASQASVCPRYCIFGSYDYTQSSTYVNLTSFPPFQISYVDGTTISGTYLQDTLTMGSTTLTNLTMARATHVTNRAFGIMGIGYPGDESLVQINGQTYPNIIDVLKSEGKINTRAYSLWLDDVDSNTGAILFGGVDKNKYTGNLVSLPIQKDQYSGTISTFTVALTGIQVVVPGQSYNLSPSSPVAAILDSGTSITYLPNNIYSQFQSGLGALSDPSYGDLVPCDYANDNFTIQFTFGGNGGATIAVPIYEIILDTVTNNRGGPVYFNNNAGSFSGRQVCTLGIAAAGSNPILFGDTFLRSAYVVYDLDNNMIALAQTNFNSNSQNIDTISSSIPDVVSTASSASVAATSNTARVDGGQSSIVATSFNVGASRTATFKMVSATGSVYPTVAATGGASGTTTSTATKTGAASSNLRSPSWSISMTGVVSGVVVVAGILFGSGLLLI